MIGGWLARLFRRIFRRDIKPGNVTVTAFDHMLQHYYNREHIERMTNRPNFAFSTLIKEKTP